jgi:hypothetical protein
MTIELQLDDTLREEIERISGQAGLSVADWLKQAAQEAVRHERAPAHGLPAFIGLGGSETAPDLSTRVDEMVYER